MNKIIKVIRLKTPEDIRLSIERIVDQLEKNNYAISKDPRATRLFARFVPDLYRNNGTIIIKEGIVVIKPEYHIERISTHQFKVKLNIN